ncbi:MAG: ATP-dependent DNA helicase RecG [Syntrophomonadaceae bacterium]|jgi:ATP-dependent DNA helicase RecG|nr:ATP-dependent DNA helicase RecG [Syntrophomonadaceae bacterium]
MDKLFQEVQFLPGVGPSRSEKLARLNIFTIFDLFWNIPRTYLNRNETHSIGEIEAGGKYNIKGTVSATKLNRSYRGMGIFKALIQDDTAAVTAVWFNQAYLDKAIKPGQSIFVSGRVKGNGAANNYELMAEEYEILDAAGASLPILPVYYLTEGLNQKRMRALIVYILANYLPRYKDIFTLEQKRKYHLCDIGYALYNIHFPAGRSEYLQAKKRLAVEELVLFLSKLRQGKVKEKAQPGLAHKEKYSYLQQVYEQLPFSLTAAQKRVLRLIFDDMEKAKPMNRMLQGDVGAGKTVIAALGLAKSAASGFQGVLMAPTEVLAQQHYQALSGFYRNTELNIALLTGSTAGAARKNILNETLSGNVHVLLGTHALLQGDVEFKNLGLVIIDEQHRFGVKQRSILGAKGQPDFLMMTATPIPRTLALTVYGDLDVAVIDELPPGRLPIKTELIPADKRETVYTFIYEKIKADADTQVFVVCPLIEESEKQDWLAAVALYDILRQKYPDIQVALLHGRLKAAGKKAIMESFQQGQTKILVSTTVIEVGVDVPSAVIMVVEQAERFGLSQLHQLRGRVGRGKEASYCFLISDPPTDEAWQRLRAMEKTNDGFVLAQEDLKIRGPGEFWGIKQHGLNQMKVANLIRHGKWIELSRQILEEENIDYAELEDYIKNKFPDRTEAKN